MRGWARARWARCIVCSHTTQWLAQCFLACSTRSTRKQTSATTPFQSRCCKPCCPCCAHGRTETTSARMESRALSVCCCRCARPNRLLPQQQHSRLPQRPRSRRAARLQTQRASSTASRRPPACSTKRSTPWVLLSRRWKPRFARCRPKSLPPPPKTPRRARRTTSETAAAAAPWSAGCFGSQRTACRRRQARQVQTRPR
mmetsp:Transcript_6062/g.12890  ORF Transcript_6062/g.12890 Transcript_6062/m.12890 type:complete len:200 (-) Transcript_6062:122-721(-)